MTNEAEGGDAVGTLDEADRVLEVVGAEAAQRELPAAGTVT